MGSKIRSFEKEDSPFIREIAGKTGLEEEEIEEIFENEVLVFEKGNEAAGFISFDENPKELYIYAISVKKDFQSEGIGKKLLGEVELIASERGFEKLITETSNDNIPALGLYQKFGFEITEVKIGELVEHHGEEEKGWNDIPVRDLIKLEKPLRKK